jgi:hypothetical protein
MLLTSVRSAPYFNLAGELAILTEILAGFPQSFQANSVMEP